MVPNQKIFLSMDIDSPYFIFEKKCEDLFVG